MQTLRLSAVLVLPVACCLSAFIDYPDLKNWSYGSDSPQNWLSWDACLFTHSDSILSGAEPAAPDPAKHRSTCLKLSMSHLFYSSGIAHVLRMVCTCLIALLDQTGLSTLPQRALRLRPSDDSVLFRMPPLFSPSANSTSQGDDFQKC